MHTRPIHSIYAAVLVQARMRPHDVAVVSPTTNITYRRFASDIDRVSRHLQALALPADSRVAVLAGSPYLHWLANIALSRLELLACSCKVTDLEVLAPTVIITDAKLNAKNAKVVEITGDWIKPDADSLAPVKDDAIDGDKPARIVLSSGTTGVSKMALFTAAQMDERLRGMALAYAFTAKTRALNLMGVNTAGGFVWPVGIWMAGGTMMLTFVSADKPIHHLLRDKPNMLFTSTAQLEGLVEALPNDFTPMTDLVTYVAGSALTRHVNRRARMRLTPQLVMIYGSTEVGSVTIAPAAATDTRPGLTGYVFPPAQVRIVDADFNDVPEGEVGEVITRGEGQISRFLDDEATTAQTFHGDWFRPGDLGSLGPNGELYVKGRVRELMNFGGVKITPEAMEEVFAGMPGVTELASFAAMRADGKPYPAVAVVAATGYSEDELMRRYKTGFPHLPPLKVVQVKALPRNDMGKVKRVQLAADHPVS